MRFGKLLLISIFIIAILTTSSLAAVGTVTIAGQIPNQTVDWPPNQNFTFPKFNSSLGQLVRIDFTATLNGSIYGMTENRNDGSLAEDCYFQSKTNLSVTMINGEKITLSIDLRVPKTGNKTLERFTPPEWAGNDTLSGSDYDHTQDRITYTKEGDLDNYIGTGTFKLDANATSSSSTKGGGVQLSNISTFGWSNGILIYTYDPRGLSGYKKDACTGLPLSGWKIVVANSTHQWNATTDANGFWQVCDLTNGSYTVCESLQPGWIQTSSPACHTVTLAGFAVANINFTNRKLHSISGYKLGCNNSLISGWNITLKNDTHTVSMLTGPDGKYEFCNLLPGSYTLTEENRAGYEAVSVVSNPLNLNCSNITNQNFTNSQLFCIGGRKVDTVPAKVLQAGR